MSLRLEPRTHYSKCQKRVVRSMQEYPVVLLNIRLLIQKSTTILLGIMKYSILKSTT